MKNFCLVFGLILLHVYGLSQLSVAPSILFLNEKQSFGSFRLMNTLPETVEVSVEVVFSYPNYDSTGAIILSSTGSIQEQFDLSDHIRIFPARFFLKPKEFRELRISIPDHSELPNNKTYFTRLNILSHPQKKAMPSQTLQESVATVITMKIQQNLGVFFQKGKTKAQIEAEFVDCVQDSTGLNLLSKINWSGNSPYLGSFKAHLFDANGDSLHYEYRHFHAYMSSNQKINFPVMSQIDDSVLIKIEWKSQRSDVPTKYLPPTSNYMLETWLTCRRQENANQTNRQP